MQKWCEYSRISGKREIKARYWWSSKSMGEISGRHWSREECANIMRYKIKFLWINKAHSRKPALVQRKSAGNIFLQALWQGPATFYMVFRKRPLYTKTEKWRNTINYEFYHYIKIRSNVLNRLAKRIISI